MEEIVGRLTPHGWLIFHHLKGISNAETNPQSDRVELDVEIGGLWALVRCKVAGNGYFSENWPKLVEELKALQGRAPEMQTWEAAAARLDIRIRMKDCLVTAAVEEGILDVHDLPTDVVTARR